MSLTSIENGVSSLYFKKIYNIKPTVLKKYNTGYISGLLTKMIARQVNAYTQTVQQFPLSLFYILFFSYKIWDFHWSLGLAFVFLILLAVTFQIIGSRFVKKRASELTEAEGLRNKLVADTVINIGTVQKMQGFDFIDSKMVERVEDCRRRTIKYSMTKEFFFCFFKMSIFMFVPICLLIYFNFLQGTSFDAVGFFSLISVVGLQLVHIAKHFSVTFEKNMEFLGAKKKLDDVVADMNKRNQLDENDFVSAKIENLDFTYQIEKENIDKLVHINIPLFELNRGDITCIYGESGQGKTTLLHILSGEIETDNVYINGEKTDKRLEGVFIA
jgi:ABC-type bacteriocin/lantibiotic exporter with double-glycine peptidase domain